MEQREVHWRWRSRRKCIPEPLEQRDDESAAEGGPCAEHEDHDDRGTRHCGQECDAEGDERRQRERADDRGS